MSWVWEYFKKKEGKAVCHFEDGNGSICGAKLDFGNNTSSLSYHLVNKHGLAKGAPAKKQRRLVANSSGLMMHYVFFFFFFCHQSPLVFCSLRMSNCA